MLIHPMVDRLRDLGLTAMADAFIEMRSQPAADDLSREDWCHCRVNSPQKCRLKFPHSDAQQPVLCGGPLPA